MRTVRREPAAAARCVSIREELFGRAAQNARGENVPILRFMRAGQFHTPTGRRAGECPIRGVDGAFQTPLRRAFFYLRDGAPRT